MSVFTILFLLGAIAVGLALLTIAVSRDPIGQPVIALALFAGFVLLTGVTIAHDGVQLVVENHTMNFWGIQVWYDLLFAVGIALFFIVPRARAVGMHVIPWIIFVGLTASIGLLAMVARLFILEKKAND